MSTRCAFTCLEGSRARELSFDIRSFVIAGWTGRDAQAVELHIRELEAIGVRRPASVPMFYRVAASNVTRASLIQVAGRRSTGEVEFVLVQTDARLWIGLGSDHTDRELEKHSVSLSKQVCAKPIAPALWRFEDVVDHWDELELRSHAFIGGKRRLYQEGSVRSLRRPEELIRAYGDAAGLDGSELPTASVMYCGTLPVQGEIEFAERFELELHDPRLGRSLQHSYDIEPLPLAD